MLSEMMNQILSLGVACSQRDMVAGIARLTDGDLSLSLSLCLSSWEGSSQLDVSISVSLFLEKMGRRGQC